MIRLIYKPIVLFVLSSTSVFAQRATPKPVAVDIINAQGKSVGTAQLSQVPNGVKIKLEIKSLPPGPHFMHIHEYPKCDPPDFKSAGAHFNAAGENHGEHGHMGLPAGDIPNFVLVAVEVSENAPPRIACGVITKPQVRSAGR